MNLDFLKTISYFEISNTGLFLAITTLILALCAIYITNNRRSAVVIILSQIKTVAICAIALYIIYISDRIVLNNRYYFILILPYTINFLNLLALALEYGKLRQEKGFDIDHVSRYHFDLSLQTGLIISLLTLIGFAFIPKELSFIVALTSLLSIISMSLTHFFVRRFFKEK